MGTPLRPIQVAKRLVEADGYLELGLPHLALERLSPLAGDDPYSTLTAYMRGRALRIEACGPESTAVGEFAQELPESLSRQLRSGSPKTRSNLTRWLT